MPRSTYNEEGNYRTYPDSALSYDRLYDGREITAETEFDEVRIECSCPRGGLSVDAWVYNDGVTKVSQDSGQMGCQFGG